MASSKRKQPRSANAREPSQRNTSDALDDESVDYEAVDYEALARFRYELRKFQAFSQTAASNAYLTSQQHQALLIIRGSSNRNLLSVGELAQLLLIRHHTAVELVDRMTKLGLLNRMIDGADGRRVLLELTKEGERRLQRLSRIHLAELRAIAPALTKMLKSFRRF